MFKKTPLGPQATLQCSFVLLLLVPFFFFFGLFRTVSLLLYVRVRLYNLEKTETLGFDFRFLDDPFELCFSLFYGGEFDNMRKKLDTRFPAVSDSSLSGFCFEFLYVLLFSTGCLFVWVFEFLLHLWDELKE